jgi:hypothetical protein
MLHMCNTFLRIDRKRKTQRVFWQAQKKQAMPAFFK